MYSLCVVTLLAACSPALLIAIFLALAIVVCHMGQVTIAHFVPLLLIMLCSCGGSAAAAILFRWCFPGQRSPSVSALAGMFVLMVMFGNSDIPPLLFRDSMAYSEGSSGTFLVVGLVVSTFGLVLLTMCLTVLALELPIVWGLGKLGAPVRKEACAELRWCGVMWFMVQGWPLLEAFVERGWSNALSLATDTVKR